MSSSPAALNTDAARLLSRQRDAEAKAIARARCRGQARPPSPPPRADWDLLGSAPTARVPSRPGKAKVSQEFLHREALSSLLPRCRLTQPTEGEPACCASSGRG